MNLKIKKGQSFFFSQRGHNGFFYPGEKKSNIIHDASASKLSWIGSSKKTAFVVAESAVLPFGSDKKKAVIWI